jgi:DNA-binding CsgD family transcriptional regulator
MLALSDGTQSLAAPGAKAAAVGDNLAAQDLVRRLSAHCARSFPQPEPGTVMLDIEVDGVRCVVVAARLDLARQRISLSPREAEIARMVAEGYPNKTIAAVLDISTWTVSTHLRRIFAKLGVRSRAAMVARLADDGLLQETSRA